MASLRSKVRNGRRYFTIRTRAGQELAAGWDRKTALAILAKHESDERLGAHGIAIIGRSTWTLKKLSEWDLEQAELAGNETASRGRRWAVLLDAFGASSRIQTISAADIENYTKKRLAGGTARATVNRDRALLRVALARARNPASMSGYSGDPFAGLRTLEERSQRKTTSPLRAKQIKKLLNEAWRLAANPPNASAWNAVDPWELHQDACMIELAFLTASRVGQITHLKWSQIRGGQLVFDGHKRGVPRYFKLTGRLKEILTSLPRDNEWVFPSARSLGPRQGFRRFWTQICKNLGITGVTPHTLRHSASSLAFSRGALIGDVQRLLGHTTPQMATTVYSQLYPHEILPISPNRAPNSPKNQHRGRAVFT